MARRRTKGTVALVATLMLLLSSVFSGAALAQRGGGGDDGGSPGLTADFVCKSLWTNQLRLVFEPVCESNEQLIEIATSLPFDYCYSLYSGVIYDDLPGDMCARGFQYAVIEDQTSFFVCYVPYTGQIRHMESPDSACAGTTTFFTDFRGDITKFACVEENLNHNECDVIPGGGPQNEIRHLTPVDPFAFAARTFKLEFRGERTVALSPFSDVDTSPAGIEAALEALSTIGMGNVSVTALDPGEFWTKAADIFNTPEDESTPIRVEFTGALGAQDITDPILLVEALSISGAEEFTVIDGTPAGSPGLNNVMPGGTVQIFEAPAGTDPNNPATYGPLVISGAVNAAGSFAATDLLEGDYVVCATGTDAVTPSCEVVTIFDNELSIVNNVDMFGTISAAITDTVGMNEIQTFNDFDGFPGFVSGGTYTITFDGSTTAALAFDADAATIEAALEVLTSINGDNVTVTGGPPNQAGPEVVIEFINALGGQNVPQITIDNSSLTGGGFVGYFVNQNLTDVDGFDSVHTLTADARVSGGTFTLTYDNGVTVSTTGPLDWDASVTDIETALNGLASINSGGGSVTVVSTDPDFIPGNEPITQAPVDVTFDNVPNSDTNVLVVDNTNLT